MTYIELRPSDYLGVNPKVRFCIERKFVGIQPTIPLALCQCSVNILPNKSVLSFCHSYWLLILIRKVGGKSWRYVFKETGCRDMTHLPPLTMFCIGGILVRFKLWRYAFREREFVGIQHNFPLLWQNLYSEPSAK